MSRFFAKKGISPPSPLGDARYPTKTFLYAYSGFAFNTLIEYVPAADARNDSATAGHNKITSGSAPVLLFFSSLSTVCTCRSG